MIMRGLSLDQPRDRFQHVLAGVAGGLVVQRRSRLAITLWEPPGYTGVHLLSINEPVLCTVTYE